MGISICQAGHGSMWAWPVNPVGAISWAGILSVGILVAGCIVAGMKVYQADHDGSELYQADWIDDD